MFRHCSARWLAGAVVVLCVALTAVPASADTTRVAVREAKVCRNVSYYGKHYPLRVLRGQIGCSRALRVMTHFFRAVDPQFAGWRCFYGHGSDIWSGTCIRGSERRPRVVVRAYNPVD